VYIRQVITAQNCIVEMPKGHECGYLQNLTINANYNLQPVRNLYQHTIQHHALGIVEYNATAQRAFVELDSIFGNDKNILDFLNGIQGIKNTVGNLNSAGDQLRQFMDSVGTVARSIYDFATSFTTPKIDEIEDTINKLLTGEKNIGDLFTIFEFDIRVTNPIVKFPNFESSELNEFLNRTIGNRQELYILNGCKVSSRSTIITPANVAVMENINIVARNLTDSVFKQ